eukprot:gene17522-23840_t
MTSHTDAESVWTRFSAKHNEIELYKARIDLEERKKNPTQFKGAVKYDDIFSSAIHSVARAKSLASSTQTLRGEGYQNHTPSYIPEGTLVDILKYREKDDPDSSEFGKSDNKLKQRGPRGSDEGSDGSGQSGQEAGNNAHNDNEIGCHDLECQSILLTQTISPGASQQDATFSTLAEVDDDSDGQETSDCISATEAMYRATGACFLAVQPPPAASAVKARQSSYCCSSAESGSVFDSTAELMAAPVGFETIVRHPRPVSRLSEDSPKEDAHEKAHRPADVPPSTPAGGLRPMRHRRYVGSVVVGVRPMTRRRYVDTFFRPETYEAQAAHLTPTNSLDHRHVAHSTSESFNQQRLHPHSLSSPKQARAGSPKQALAGSQMQALAGSPKQALAGSQMQALARSPKQALSGITKQALAGSPKTRPSQPTASYGNLSTLVSNYSCGDHSESGGSSRMAKARPRTIEIIPSALSSSSYSPHTPLDKPPCSSPRTPIVAAPSTSRAGTPVGASCGSRAATPDYHFEIGTTTVHISDANQRLLGEISKRSARDAFTFRSSHTLSLAEMDVGQEEGPPEIPASSAVSSMRSGSHSFTNHSSQRSGSSQPGMLRGLAAQPDARPSTSQARSSHSSSQSSINNLMTCGVGLRAGSIPLHSHRGDGALVPSPTSPKAAVYASAIGKVGGVAGPPPATRLRRASVDNSFISSNVPF